MSSKCATEAPQARMLPRAAKISGEWQDVYKDPITDKGKRSKRGRLILTRERGKWETLNMDSGYNWADMLVPVYRDGKLLRDYTFQEIRDRSDSPALD